MVKEKLSMDNQVFDLDLNQNQGEKLNYDCDQNQDEKVDCEAPCTLSLRSSLFPWVPPYMVFPSLQVRPCVV